MKETSPGGGKLKKGQALQHKPWVEKCDVPLAKVDDVLKVNNVEEGAPKLYLFFQNGKFDIAEVAVDGVVLHLQAADVVKALISYIGVYYTFHVGYAVEHQQFLGFMQYSLLGKPYLGKKGLGHLNLIAKFDEEMKKKIEAKQYKKFCV